MVTLVKTELMKDQAFCLLLVNANGAHHRHFDQSTMTGGADLTGLTLLCKCNLEMWWSVSPVNGQYMPRGHSCPGGMPWKQTVIHSEYRPLPICTNLEHWSDSQ